MDSSGEVLTTIASTYGRISSSGTYSCSRAKKEGACALAMAEDVCPITCSLCHTPAPWTWNALSAHYCISSQQRCDPATRCGFPLKTAVACEHAAGELGHDTNNATVFSNQGAPTGCFVTVDKQLYFNQAAGRTNSNFDFAKSLCNLNNVPPKTLKETSVAIQACGRNRTMPMYDIAPTQLDAVLRNRSLMKGCNPCALRLVGEGMAALSKNLGFGGDGDLDLVIMGQPWAGHTEPQTVFDLNMHSLGMTAVNCFPACPAITANRTASLCIQDMRIQHGSAMNGVAINVLGHVTADVFLHIQSCVLQFNEAFDEGGMIFACTHMRVWHSRP